MLVSGALKGEDELEGRPAILDLPAGKGRVIAFNFNPIHRDLNRSDHRFLWNVLLNWITSARLKPRKIAVVDRGLSATGQPAGPAPRDAGAGRRLGMHPALKAETQYIFRIKDAGGILKRRFLVSVLRRALSIQHRSRSEAHRPRDGVGRPLASAADPDAAAVATP